MMYEQISAEGRVEWVFLHVVMKCATKAIHCIKVKDIG